MLIYIFTSGFKITFLNIWTSGPSHICNLGDHILPWVKLDVSNMYVMHMLVFAPTGKYIIGCKLQVGVLAKGVCATCQSACTIFKNETEVSHQIKWWLKCTLQWEPENSLLRAGLCPPFLPVQDFTCSLSDLWGASSRCQWKREGCKTSGLWGVFLCTCQEISEKRSKTLRKGYLMDTFQRNWEIFLDTKERKKIKCVL